MITSIAQFNQYVSVNRDFDLQQVQNFEAKAVEKYLLRFFHQALIDEVYGYDAEPVGSKKKRAYEALMSSLSNLTLYELLPFAEVQVGDGGVTRVENENTKTAHAGQIKRLNELLLSSGYSGIDLMISLMIETPGDFTEWANAPAKKATDKLLIKTASEFDENKRLFRKNVTFFELTPDMKDVQTFYLTPWLDATLLDELIVNASGMHAKKVQLRAYLISAICALTVFKGIKKGLVKLTADGVRLIEHDKDTSKELESKPDLFGVSATLNEYESIGMRYIDLAKKYMADNTDVFTVEEETTEPKKVFWM